jgi:monoamine oxidase
MSTYGRAPCSLFHGMDVAIIGAGTAGLEAARVLSERGLAVELIEATDYVGGRVRTVRATGAAPIELGPEFVHGKPELLRSLVPGARFELDAVRDIHHIQRGGALVAIDDTWGRFRALLRPAKHLADESARAFIARTRPAPADASLLAQLIEGFYGAPLDDIGIRGIAEDAGGAGGSDAPAMFRVRGGYGHLVEWALSRIAWRHVVVHHGCVVRGIDWSHDHVRIDFTRAGMAGSTFAKRAIVTLPVGVLRDGSVTFTPALGAHRDALGMIGMGQVVKVVLVADEAVWPAQVSFIHAGDGAFPVYWVQSRGDVHQLTAWAGGLHARSLAGQPLDVLAGRAIDGFARLVAIPRARLEAAIVAHHHHDFDADPFARGAYSYLRVGGRDAARVLAKPLADRLYFAGEATDPDLAGTVTGALRSGARAAQQILATIERP